MSLGYIVIPVNKEATELSSGLGNQPDVDTTSAAAKIVIAIELNASKI